MAIGIDFGTTNSLLALYDGKQTHPYLNDEGLPHPSVVWYQGDRVTVGAQAKRNINTYGGQPGHRFVRSIKRSLGQNRTVEVFGRRLEAWQVASEVFAHLKRHAEGIAGRDLDTWDCVVTVPVYYDGRYRADVRRAAEHAGFHVSAFVHEPFAALVGYLINTHGSPPDWSQDRNVLVFDWGGGTLDITLITVANGRIYERGTGGLTDYAGDQFDKLLENHMLERFAAEHGLDIGQIKLPNSSWDRLNYAAERTKIELSVEQSAQFPLHNFYRDDKGTYGLAVQVTRQAFETMIQGTVARAMGQVDHALHAAGLTYGDVDMVLLVGGTSQIPLVGQELRDRFGHKVTAVQKAPSLIAEGAAVIAHHGWKPYLVNPISLQLSDGTYYRIFGANTPMVPETAKREVTLFCTDPREGVARLVVAEETQDGRRHLQVVQVPVQPVLGPDLERIGARFEFDADLILNVTGVGSATGEPVTAQVYDLRMGLQFAEGAKGK